MVNINPIGIVNPVRTRIDAYRNVSPFTIRSATSYQEELEDIRRAVNTELVGRVNDSLASILKALQDAVDSQSDDIGRLVAEVNAEVNRALRDVESATESVIDSSVTVQESVVNRMFTEPNNALSRTFKRETVGRGMATADDGHEYVWLAGVIRNEGDGWKLLPEDTNHRPVNIGEIETIVDANGRTGEIVVHYPDAVGPRGMTIAFMAVPDETLARNGFTCGTSVTATESRIRISQSAPAASDFVFYNGTEWVSYDGVFSDITFNDGVLNLTHPRIPLASQYSISVTPRTDVYRYSVSSAGAPTSETSITLDVYEEAPEYADMVTFNGTDWVSYSGVFKDISFNAGVLTVNHPQLGGESVQRLSVSGRGAYRVTTSATTSPVTGTTIKLDVRDSAGALVTAAATGMTIYIRHGGGKSKATAPNPNMRFYISHGGGNRQWNPATLTTQKYPASNIWLYGIMGRRLE